MTEMTPTATLDHFIGQQVADVLAGGSTWDWSIQLESGIVITNKDQESATPPEGIEGKILCTVVFSELDTRLQFGLTTADGVIEEVWVTLSPLLYTIGGIEGQQMEYYPQNPPEIQDALPPDPSGDRVATGPEPQVQVEIEQAEAPPEKKKSKKSKS